MSRWRSMGYYEEVEPSSHAEVLREVLRVIWLHSTAWEWHVLNNDHSHRVFIYVLKKRRLCSHFPALSPCTDDKVGKASARWRRGVIYNHINPFTFHAGLGHCHLCPRGESHNPTLTNSILLISGMMSLSLTFIPGMVIAYLCFLWPSIAGRLLRAKSISIFYSAQ